MIKFYNNNSKKTCALSISFEKAGSFCEPKDKEGWIHFAEHMMLTATKNTKYKKLSKKIDKDFLFFQVFTSRESIDIYCVFIIDDLNEVLETLREMLYDWQCPKDFFQEEKRIILDELYEYNNSYDGKLFLDSLKFLNLKKKHSPLGSYKQINKIKYNDLEKIKKFWLQKIKNSEKDILIIGRPWDKTKIKKLKEIFPKNKTDKKYETKKEEIIFNKNNNLAVLSFKNKNQKNDFWNNLLYRIFYFRWYKKYSEHLDFRTGDVDDQWFCYIKNVKENNKYFLENIKDIFFEKPSKKEFELAKKTYIDFLYVIFETNEVVDSLKFFYFEKKVYKTKKFYLDKNKMIRFYKNLKYDDFIKYFKKIEKSYTKKTA